MDADVTGAAAFACAAYYGVIIVAIIAGIENYFELSGSLRLSVDVQRRARLYTDTPANIQRRAVLQNQVDCFSVPDKQTAVDEQAAACSIPA